MKSNLYEIVEDAEQKLENARNIYLRSNGWTYSSSNPARIWLWSKEEHTSCSTSVAIQTQRMLDPVD